LTVLTDDPEQPDVPVEIELGDALRPLAGLPDSATAARRLAAELTVLLARLGVPGKATVELSQVVESDRPLRVRVHGAVEAYPPHLLTRAWVAVAPPELRTLPAAAGDGSSFPAEWLAAYAHDGVEGTSPDPAMLLSFVERVVLQVVLRRPSCLLGPAQAEAYAKPSSLSIDDLTSILGSLLDLGVSVADRQLMARVLEEGTELQRPLEDTVEEAFTELRGQTVELHLHPETLEMLLMRPPGPEPFSVYDERVADEFQDLFREMEKTFFAAFGFLLPDLVLVPAPAMRAGMVTVRLGEWWGLPVPVIPRGQRLVDAEPHKVRTARGRLSIHPVSSLFCPIADDDEKDALERAGHSTWGPIDFIRLTALADLSRRAGRLLGMEEVEYQLAQLETADTPSPGFFRPLVRAALATHSLGDLTRVLRSLVDERLSFRDLPGLLERLVQFDTVRMDRDDLVLFDDRLALDEDAPPEAEHEWRAHYAFLRKQLRAYLTQTYSFAERLVLVYRVDHELERRVAGAARAAVGAAVERAFGEPDIEPLRDAVWHRVRAHGPVPFGQVVLTSQAARPGIRELLAPEFPDLPVLADSELAADADIRVLGTIEHPARPIRAASRRPVGFAATRPAGGG
jgi:flagellar biosynthesis component FlhA